jgi:hypothetical protein
MAPNPLSGDGQEVLIGVLIGVLAAIPVHLLLRRRNRRWTWALLAAGAGAAALALRIIESWSVALLIGGILAARWAYLLERRDREAGGDARRRADQAVGITAALAQRRARRLVQRGEFLGDGGFVLGFDSRGGLVRLRFGEHGGRHGLMLGASGSGKSNALLWAVRRHVEAGFGALVVDMKADRSLASAVRAAAEQWAPEFHFWSLDGGDRWNPLASGNRSELKDKLIATEEFSERHYEAMYERYLVNLFHVLDHRERDRHLRSVVRLLDPNELAMEARQMPNEEAGEEIGRYLASLTDDQRKHLSGLRDRLALLIEGGQGEWLLPFDEPHGEIELRHALLQGAVVVFSLDSSRYGATARLIGNLVIQDLKAVCGHREAHPELARPALVAVDEFSGLNGDQIAGLFQRARSADLSLILATQELADLRRVDEGFDEQVIGNVEWLLAGRQNNPTSAETIAEIAGTEEVWVHTFQTDEGSRHKRAQFGRESGIGTKHRGREFHVSPDEIKRLDVGQMLLVKKNPHRVEVVQVLQAPGAPRQLSEAA